MNALRRPSDQELFSRLDGLIGDTVPWPPDGTGFGGTGGPGLVLEYLLGLPANNRDGPDSGNWEIKYHGGRSNLLTLFHKSPENNPGALKSLVHNCGWLDRKGRKSFRHTLKRRSERGFYVVKDGNRIVVRNDEYDNIVPPYWSCNTLITAFAFKLRRLILVNGTTSKARREVTFNGFRMYEEPRSTDLIDAILCGIVAIDFDAREELGKNSLRDHGTKFRIDVGDLRKIYDRDRKFGGSGQ